MDLLHLSTKNTRISSVLTIEFSLFLILLIFSIAIYPFDQKLSYILFLLITLTYSMLNFITAYLSLRKNKIATFSIISLILSVSYITYSLYLLIGLSIRNIPPFLKTTIDLLFYLRPCLTALAILFVFSLSDKIVNFKKASTLLVAITIVPITIIFTSYPNNFINISIISILYIASLLFLWNQHSSVENLDFIYAMIGFILMTISESIIIVNNGSNLGIFYNLILNITLVFPLYILYTVQVQYFILTRQSFAQSQQDLYKLNADLMNKFFIFKDTEMQNLKAKISAKDGLYKQLFDFAPDAFLIFINSKITYINQATISLLNAKDQNDIINTPIWRFVHPNSAHLIRPIYESNINSKSNTTTDEFQIVTLDKQVKDVRISFTKLYFNEEYYTILSLHDLSKEKAHKLIRSQLEENVANEKSKVEFFANISHDLKTPVNVIYSATQLQNLCITDHQYDKAKMYNNVIKQNCLRLQKLLNDLLDITKLDAHCFKPSPRPCNIIQVIENIVESVTSYVEQKNISIIFDTNVEEKFVLTDPDLIERILLNLISNAIKYGKEKGHIWASLYDEGEHLIVSIKDDGMGIPKSELPYIFKRFHKVADYDKRPTSGNGIGLSLVNSIVEVLGGTIFCLSEEGLGSEFVLILPMAPCSDDYNGTNPEYVTCSESINQLNIELSDT